MLLCLGYSAGVIFLIRHVAVAFLDSTMQDYYGSVPVTMQTLFAAVTGGYDWAIVSNCLDEVGLLYTFCFLLFVEVIKDRLALDFFISALFPFPFSPNKTHWLLLVGRAGGAG